MRDWSRGLGLGYYNIHPSQCNTRMPLHINDDDLCPTIPNSNVQERPRSEYTMLSYTVHALEIANFARESTDLRGPLRQGQNETNELAKMRNHLNKKYQRFVAALPSHFKLGSSVGLTSAGAMAAIPVQRWMLHQQLWGLFLRLHRTSLSSQSGRASCQLLAQNIISTQAQIKARCAVCGSLSTSETQVFNAAIVLLIDLLFSSPTQNELDRSSSQLSRLMIRDKALEAIELLRTIGGAEDPPFQTGLTSGRVKGSAHRGMLILEALMTLEEEESCNDKESQGENALKDCLDGQDVTLNSSTRNSLKSKVMGILENLQGSASMAAKEQVSSNFFSAPEIAVPSTDAFSGFQDLNVLPVLSNDPCSDFWQFLDFAPFPQPTTEDISFSAD